MGSNKHVITGNGPVLVMPGHWLLAIRATRPSTAGCRQPVAAAVRVQHSTLANLADHIIPSERPTIDGRVHQEHQQSHRLRDRRRQVAAVDPENYDATKNDTAGSWCPGKKTYGKGDYGSPGTANPPCLNPQRQAGQDLVRHYVVQDG
jgi:hypothetical protein